MNVTWNHLESPECGGLADSLLVIKPIDTLNVPYIYIYVFLIRIFFSLAWSLDKDKLFACEGTDIFHTIAAY
jgi:hypothetical protein